MSKSHSEAIAFVLSSGREMKKSVKTKQHSSKQQTLDDFLRSQTSKCENVHLN